MKAADLKPSWGTGEIVGFIWFVLHSVRRYQKKQKNPNLSDMMEVH